MPADPTATSNNPWTEAHGIEKNKQGQPHPPSEALKNIPCQDNPYQMASGHRWETCTDDAKALVAYYIQDVLNDPIFGEQETAYGPRLLCTDADKKEFARIVPTKASIQEDGINAEYMENGARKRSKD